MTSGDMVTFAGPEPITLSQSMVPGILWEIYKRDIIRGIYVEDFQWDDILSKIWVLIGMI